MFHNNRMDFLLEIALESFLKIYHILTSENSPERRSLAHCVAIIKEIIGHVERQIDARSKELRLFEVYNRLDARSTTTLNGKKFKVII